MARAQLSPLATLMIRRLAERAGLSPEAVMELALADYYMAHVNEPVGLPDPSVWRPEGVEPPDASQDAPQSADEPSDDLDPDDPRQVILRAAEAMTEPFTSADLKAIIEAEGRQTTTRSVAQILSNEGWPAGTQKDCKGNPQKVWQPLG